MGSYRRIACETAVWGVCPGSEMCFEITEEDDRFWYDKEDILRVYELGLKLYVDPSTQLLTIFRPVTTQFTRTPGRALVAAL